MAKYLIVFVALIAIAAAWPRYGGHGSGGHNNVQGGDAGQYGSPHLSNPVPHQNPIAYNSDSIGGHGQHDAGRGGYGVHSFGVHESVEGDGFNYGGAVQHDGSGGHVINHRPRLVAPHLSSPVPSQNPTVHNSGSIGGHGQHDAGRGGYGVHGSGVHGSVQPPVPAQNPTGYNSGTIGGHGQHDAGRGGYGRGHSY